MRWSFAVFDWAMRRRRACRGRLGDFRVVGFGSGHRCNSLGPQHLRSAARASRKLGVALVVYQGRGVQVLAVGVGVQVPAPGQGVQPQREGRGPFGPWRFHDWGFWAPRLCLTSRKQISIAQRARTGRRRGGGGGRVGGEEVVVGLAPSGSRTMRRVTRWVWFTRYQSTRRTWTSLVMGVPRTSAATSSSPGRVVPWTVVRGWAAARPWCGGVRVCRCVVARPDGARRRGASVR